MAVFSPQCFFSPHCPPFDPAFLHSRHLLTSTSTTVSVSVYPFSLSLLLQQHPSSFSAESVIAKSQRSHSDISTPASDARSTLSSSSLSDCNTQQEVETSFNSDADSHDQQQSYQTGEGDAPAQNTADELKKSRKSIIYTLQRNGSLESTENSWGVESSLDSGDTELVGRFASQAAIGSSTASARTLSSEESYVHASDAKQGTNTATSPDKKGAIAATPTQELNLPQSSVSIAASASSAFVDGSERLPINRELDLYRAKCLFRKGESREAEVILRQCVKDWPSDGKAYVCLGTRLMKQGRIVEARTLLEDGCQATRGENPYIWQAWATLEVKVGRISQARKLFDAAIAADLKHAAAWHAWAVLELRLGSTRKARDLLSKGIKYCGANEYLFQTSALIDYRAGNVEQARALFNQAVSSNVKSCASWVAWALMEAENRNISAARYLFQKGIRASPKNRYAWQAWALFEASQGKRGLARRLFEQGRELNPQDAVLVQAFALFEYDCLNSSTARELFQQAAALDPKHQPVWNAWGWMEWKEGNLDAARLYYKKSLAIDSTNLNAARSFHAWATLEAKAGNFQVAKELYKYALKVDSQNRPTWMSLANLEESIGNLARAEEIRSQYLQQRTEVVEEAPWDMNLSSMLAPAINRIKSFLKMDNEQTASAAALGPTVDVDDDDINDVFDIDIFIKEVLPWKYQTVTRSTTKTERWPSLS